MLLKVAVQHIINGIPPRFDVLNKLDLRQVESCLNLAKFFRCLRALPEECDDTFHLLDHFDGFGDFLYCTSNNEVQQVSKAM